MSSAIDDLPPPMAQQDSGSGPVSGIDDLPAPGVDTRTGLQKIANIVYGAYPKPEAPDTRSDAQKDADFAQYKAELPSAVAAAGSMLLPVPGAPAAAGLGAKLAAAGGRIAMSSGAGGVVGALQPAKDASERLDNAGSGAALGAAGGAAGEVLLGAGNAAVKGGKYVGGKLAAAAGKIGDAWSGVPEQEIKTYATQANQIKSMMQKADGELPQAADQARQKLQDQLRARRQALSAAVGSALESAGPAQTLDLQPVIDRLGEVHATIDPNLHPESAAQVEELADRVAAVAGPDGKVSPGQMHDIKEMLQESAKPSYLKNGQVFQPGKDAQLAAKGAAAVARKGVNAAVPEAAAANNQLSYMHSLEDSLNKNLLAPGKSDTALLAAGSGANPRNALMLKRLDAVAGTDSLGDAQRLAAARTFTNPSLNPLSATGKTIMHVFRGGTIGGAAGAIGAEATGFDPLEGAKIGAGIGAGLASPFALKMAINAGRIPVQAASRLAPAALQALQQYPGAVPTLINGVMQKNQPASAGPAAPPQIAQGPADRSPARGPDAWAQSGLSKLGIQDQGMSARLLADPKAKQLLIQASDLKPGSPAMKKIMDQINQKWGSK